MSIDIRTHKEFAFQTAGVIANHTDTLNKSFKVSEQLFKLVSLITERFPATAPFARGTSLLADQFKTAKTITNSFNVFERLPDWLSVENREKILSKWEKAVGRICLTVAQIFETVLFIDKCTHRFFYQAAFTVGKLPIAEGIKNFYYLLSAVCGLKCSGQDKKDASAKIEKAKSEQVKWNNFIFSNENVVALSTHYINKQNDVCADGNALRSEVQNLEASIRLNDDLLPTMSRSEQRKMHQTIKADLSLLATKKKELAALEKYAGFLEAIQNSNYDSIKNYKVQKNAVRERNNCSNLKKARLGIIVEISKIAMICLGTTIALACTAWPLLTTKAVVISVTALSLISNGLGLYKNLYGMIGPKQETVPVFRLQQA